MYSQPKDLPQPVAEFGLNAFTETLGIIVTVLIVDQLIKNQEVRKSLPLRAASYEDIRLLVVRIVTFWQQAYIQSVPMATPTIVEELLTKATFEKIALYLDLDSKPKVLPARTWWQYLPEQLNDFISHGELILERYAGNLEPQIYSLVHTLTTHITKPDSLDALRLAYEQMNQHRTHNLCNFFFTDEKFLSSVLQLHYWCKKEKAFLESFGLSIKLSVSDKLIYRDAISSPPCMISSEKLQEHLRTDEELKKLIADSQQSGNLSRIQIVQVD